VLRPCVAVRRERARTERGRGSGECGWEAVLAASHTGYVRYPDKGVAWRTRRPIWDHLSAAALCIGSCPISNSIISQCTYNFRREIKYFPSSTTELYGPNVCISYGILGLDRPARSTRAYGLPAPTGAFNLPDKYYTQKEIRTFLDMANRISLRRSAACVALALYQASTGRLCLLR